MPVYNSGKYIERALLSALNQTFSEIEYLIIDDKGSDDSIEKVKNLLNMHPRGKDVRIWDHLINRGTGATRNTAIKEALGKYLYFMDSDDEITPDCIQILYDKMQESQVDFVAGSYDHIDIEGNKLDSGAQYTDHVFKAKEGENLSDLIYRKEMNNLPVMTWNKLYDINFLRNAQIHCLPRHIHEDVLFSYQIKLKASSCRLISNITYHYYVIPNSTTDYKNRSDEKARDVARQYYEILDFKKNILANYKNKDWYLHENSSLAFEAYYYICRIIQSPIKEKKKFIKPMLKFTIKFNEAKKINRLNLYILWIVSKLPYFLQNIFITIYNKKYYS